MSVGQIYFAGDAAHLHSPVGARGMNLGIEDAWVFADLVKRGQMDRYAALRHPIDAAVVRRIRLISTIVAGESPWSRFVRSQIVPHLLGVPAIQAQMLANVSGLDHLVQI